MASRQEQKLGRGDEKAQRAFEVLSDKKRRTVYDQFGEESLKGHGGQSPGAVTGGGFSDFSGFPGAGGGAGGPTFTFTTSGPGGSYTSFNPSDPNKIFESIFGGNSPLFGMGGFGNMGGMGGGPRRGRAGSTNIFVDQDDDMSGFSPGFGVSLHDLYDGATKRLKVGRKLLNGTTEEKVLEIQIQPGWKSGTKIRFPKAGNETSYGKAQDIVFVVEEKPDPVFRRDGNSLTNIT
ncbi:hypothetical protein H1R20_g16217, partial [Candolleomyces eurysporus]